MLTFPHRFALRQGDEHVYQVRQVHGATVGIVRGGEPLSEIRAIQADALVGAAPGVVVGVRTADCVPALIEDSEAGICAAVHAGWRGLLAGVLEAAVGRMAELGGHPERFRAALGPCIGPCCFEVGEAVAARFPAEHVRAARPRPFVDLRATARARLLSLGVADIDASPPCTRCDPAGYYSYRRDGAGTPLHLHTIGVP
jgi:purine-nucleoside/S-methyl-5'-thioadenosine phosphorylase / adenosine deaminase